MPRDSAASPRGSIANTRDDGRSSRGVATKSRLQEPFNPSASASSGELRQSSGATLHCTGATRSGGGRQPRPIDAPRRSPSWLAPGAGGNQAKAAAAGGMHRVAISDNSGHPVTAFELVSRGGGFDADSAMHQALERMESELRDNIRQLDTIGESPAG